MINEGLRDSFLFFFSTLFFCSFPDTDREDKNRDNDDGTNGTERTKNSNDKFLVDHIWVKHHSTGSESREDFCWEHGFREPSPESDEEEDRVDDGCYHREGDFKISNRKDDSSRILEYSRTWELVWEIAGHQLECCTVSAIPVLVGRDWKIDGIEYADSREDGDDEIFFHNGKG